MMFPAESCNTASPAHFRKASATAPSKTIVLIIHLHCYSILDSLRSLPVRAPVLFQSKRARRRDRHAAHAAQAAAGEEAGLDAEGRAEVVAAGVEVEADLNQERFADPRDGEVLADVAGRAEVPHRTGGGDPLLVHPVAE